MSTCTTSQHGGAPVPPEDDPVYRAVIAANDPVLLTSVLEAEWRRDGVATDGMRARVVLAHYRPRARARLIVRAEIPRPGRKRPRIQFLFVQVYPNLAAARRRLGHVLKHPLKCTGPAVFLIEEWSALAWALPNGPALRTTKMLLRRPKFARFLAEAGLVPPAGHRPRTPELIRYVPRRRAVFRHASPDGGGTGPVYIKVYAPGGDGPAAGNLALAREAADATQAFTVPALVAHAWRRRALVMREIPGRNLTDFVATAGGAAFRATGRALAALHASGIRPDRTWSATAEVAALRLAMDDVVLALPVLAPTLCELVAAIDRRREELVFPVDRPIHGNMFADQVLVGDDLAIGIVDWDDLCLGDPLFDVGRLAAHALFLEQRAGNGTTSTAVPALLAGYRDGDGVIEPRRLGWHVATALLLRAKISALRPLPATWIADIERSMSAASALIGGFDIGWMP